MCLRARARSDRLPSHPTLTAEQTRTSPPPPQSILWSRVPTFPKQHAHRGAGAVDGWALHSPEALAAAVARMGAFWRGEAPRFALSRANAGYAASETYPEHFLAPTAISDAALVACSRFRSKGRLPAVVWFSGSLSLSRASQPKTGLLFARSADDERLLAALGADPAQSAVVADACAVAPAAPGVGIVIMDARPRLNAVVNCANGGGVENADNYANAKLVYLNIDNIHVVRKAFFELRSSVLRDVRGVLTRALRACPFESLALTRWYSLTHPLPFPPPRRRRD